MERQAQMAASEQSRQSLITQIAMNSGTNASSLRSEVYSQTRQGRVKLMISPMSTTTEHYDMFAADNEEEARQAHDNDCSARVIRP
eukprot:5216777-Heterocapsa_arctica.AAC.1